MTLEKEVERMSADKGRKEWRTEREEGRKEERKKWEEGRKRGRKKEKRRPPVFPF